MLSHARRIEGYVDAVDIFDRLGERSSELSDADLGFIGGVIRSFRPRRILEIGVAGGGTTAFMLNCLKKLGIDAKMYSVDISHTFHYNRNRRCGYQIDGAKKVLDMPDAHTLLLGKPIASVIDDIRTDAGGGLTCSSLIRPITCRENCWTSSSAFRIFLKARLS